MTQASRTKQAAAALRSVLATLTRAADEGRACPTNFEIAARAGIGISHASKIVTTLGKEGLIVVERGAINRVVTIVATGKRTAGVITHQHWSERGVKRAPSMVAVKPSAATPARRIMAIVTRDPCSRCGTRADFGCAHSRRPFLFTNPQPQGMRHSEGAT